MGVNHDSMLPSIPWAWTCSWHHGVWHICVCQDSELGQVLTRLVEVDVEVGTQPTGQWATTALVSGVNSQGHL